MKALTWQNEDIDVTILSSLDKVELLDIAENIT